MHKLVWKARRCIYCFFWTLSFGLNWIWWMCTSLRFSNKPPLFGLRGSVLSLDHTLWVCSARMVWDLETVGRIVLLAYPAVCWKGRLVERMAPNMRWKALGSTPGVCRFSPRTDILTVRRRFRKVYGSQPPLLFQTSTTIQSAVICIVHTVMKELVTCCSE